MSLIDEVQVLTTKEKEKYKEQILADLKQADMALQAEFQAELAKSKAEDKAASLDNQTKVAPEDITAIFRTIWGKAAQQATSMVAAPPFSMSKYLQNARMGHGPGHGIYPGGMFPAQTTTSGSGYVKQEIERAVAATKVVNVSRVWMHPLWVFKLWWHIKAIHSTPTSGLLQSNIMGCCVCKTVTPANIPFWKPFKVMKVHGLLKPEFPYKDIYNAFRTLGGMTPVSYEKRDYHFAVCSEPCENFVYLALLDL